MMKKGKLYRVNDFALSDRAEYAVSNRNIVKDHGYIWIYEGPNLSEDDEENAEDDEENAEPHLRSVATGEVQWFYLDELEAADG
jgi:hypothetical protein